MNKRNFGLVTVILFVVPVFLVGCETVAQGALFAVAPFAQSDLMKSPKKAGAKAQPKNSSDTGENALTTDSEEEAETE